MSDTSIKKYDAAFAGIKEAANASVKDDKVFAVHMWEWGVFDRANEYRKSFDATLHRKEIYSLLSVLARDEGGRYSDYEDGWRTRNYKSETGVLGLACTGLNMAAPCRLFSHSPSQTGIIFQNTPIVHAAEYDLHSKVINGNELHHAISAYNKSGGVKLCTDDTVLSQGAAEYQSILASGAEEFAQKDIAVPLPYNEVCINAELSNVSGVLVEGLVGKMGDESRHLNNDLKDGDWSEYLKANKDLAMRIAMGIREYETLEKKCSDTGSSQPLTIVIYQPDAEKAEDRLVHFPPTEKNRALIDDVLRKEHRFESAGSNRSAAIQSR